MPDTGSVWKSSCEGMKSSERRFIPKSLGIVSNLFSEEVD